MMNDSRPLVEYRGYSMQVLDRKRRRVIGLNGMNCLIGDEPLSAGIVKQAMVFPGEMVRTALAKMLSD